MNITKFLQEDNGNESSMRLIVFLIITTVLFNWTYYNIMSHQFVMLDWTSTAAMIGSLFMKAYQKGKETCNPEQAK